MLYTSKDAGESVDVHEIEKATGVAASVCAFISPRGDEPIDELGIPFRIHYIALACFAFFVAGVPLLFALTPEGAEIRQFWSYAVCGFGVAMAPAIFYFGRRRNYEFKEWVFQSVLLYSIVGPLICQFALDQLRPAVLTLYMLGPIGAAFYFPLKRALPLITVGVATIVLASTMNAEPDALLRGLVVAVITLSCALMLSAMQKHLAAAIRTNREISERDALTGAHNMRKFEERLAEEISRSQRGGSCGFALIEFDLDRFKAVNDAHNHSVGDNVLIATADAIQSVLTEADLFVRRGGDEFAVIAPEVPNRGIEVTVDRARLRVERACRSICPELSPTVSIGWADYEHGETANSILRRSDDALLEAKQFAHERDLEVLAVIGDSRPAAPREPAPTGDVLQLRRTRVAASEIGDDPMSGAMQIAWRTAGMSSILISVAVLAIVTFGHTSFPFSGTETALLVVWALVMSPIVLWASTSKQQPAFMTHILNASALVLVTLGCVAIGRAAPVAVELYLMANVIIIASLPPRSALVYATVGFTLYGYFLYSSGYALADIRLATTVVNFAIVGALLAVNRQGTLEAASEKALLARTDALTGLPNMRRLRDRIGYEIRRCATTGDSLALLMLDLDEFKSVNDTHGHTTGDEVLIAVADALEQTARHADMPARRGGDEFAVVLTEAGPDAAEIAADRVAEAVRHARLRCVADINPNASVGWVVWKRGESVDSLIRRADAALKRVRSSARDERRQRTLLSGSADDGQAL